jgi:signal transduction histidine kinase
MQTYGMEERLDTQTEITVYRIVQELVNNIIKHAQATDAIVQFNRTEKQIDITVEDSGCGFDPHKEQDSRHAGLDIIKERVNYLNGIMSIDSRANIGTTVMITFHPGNTQQHG